MAVTHVSNDGLIGPGNDKVKFTPEGGLAVKLTNKTGTTSVKGTLTNASTGTDNAFNVNPGDNPQSIGVVYESGVADGSECWMVVAGIAEVLLKDTTASTKGYWVKQSDTNGRADATNAAPPSGGVAELDVHMTEIGHCIESKSQGSNVLARIILHFN
jgi:hypothetical protein